MQNAPNGLEDAVADLVQSAEARLAEQDDTLGALRDELADLRSGASLPRGRITEPDPLGAATSTRSRQTGATGSGARVLGPVARRSATHGFNHAGDFFAAVRGAGRPGGTTDERLLAAAASTYGNETSGADGGFAVPVEYRETILSKAFGEDSLIGRTGMVPVSGNTLTIPTDMTTPWSATGGIQAYWEGEGSTYTQSKPSLQNVTVRLHKLGVLVPVSEELLDDAPAMGALVSRLASEKIDFKISNSIAYGTGSGQPLGFMNSAAIISQAAEVSQVADTIVAANVVKMSSRLPAQSRRNSVWLIHPDAEPQLSLMTLGDQPIYLPAGGMRDTPFGSLLGRPVIPHQVCQTVGDLGDIMLVDLTQYLTAIKAGGLRAQTSIHLWFDQDITAFKFTLRIAGQPWWSEATTSKNGSHTMSPFVTLAARA